MRLIRGGRVIDPASGTDAVLDVRVENGVITAIGPELSSEGAEVLEAAGLVVTPGYMDIHVHLREPGYEWKEDLCSGAKAAARGGFTTVACMPNTEPVLDNAAMVAYVVEKARRDSIVRVLPIGAVTKKQQGQELAEMGEMARAGAVAFSDDGNPVMNAEIMRCALEYAKMFGRTVIDHCEELTLAGDRAINRGFLATRLGLKGVPAAAEEVMVARDCLLAKATGGRVHIAHISTAGAVEIVRQAKAWGIPVTAEATPHHFTLTEEAADDYNTNAKVNPPLRSAADVAAVRAGLADGTIDCIATDHAPHTPDEKEAEYEMAPTGVIGLETAVPLTMTELVGKGVLTLPQAVAKLTTAPAAVLGRPLPRLTAGAPADLTVLDLAREEVVNPELFASKSRNSPFAGMRLHGIPVLTMVGGRMVMVNRQIVAGE